MKKKFDIISIGDCTVDAVVEVEEATTHCDIHHEKCQICFSFADKIPYKSLTVLSAGNSNNAAVGMARLGLKSAFHSTVGNDMNGRIILDALKKEKVNTSFMGVQQIPTNFHFVLNFKGERTILIKHQDFKYQLPKGIDNTAWIYFSSVGPKGLSLHAQLLKLLQKHTEIRMAFNPGTYQLRMGTKKLMPLFKHTEILFVNKEEARFLVGRDDEPKELAFALQKMGPKTVVITDGLKGSYCLQGDHFYYIGIYPHKVKEATGCGDAFATGFTAATILGLPIDEALRWGGRNGASVATEVGPQKGLLNRSKMERDLKSHKVFKAKEV
jgi:ribokinase